jgi:hypothetical protein
MKRAFLSFFLATFLGCDPPPSDADFDPQIEDSENPVEDELPLDTNTQPSNGEEWMCGYSIKTKGGCIAGQCGFADGWADCACAGDKCTCCPSNGSGTCKDKSQHKADICPRSWVAPTKWSTKLGDPLEGPVATDQEEALQIEDWETSGSGEDGDNFSGEPAALFSTPRLVCPADKIIKNEAGCIATECTLSKLKGLECGCVKGTQTTTGECNCCAAGGACLQTTNNICDK